MALRTQRGQGLIEAVLCLPILILFVTGIGFLAHRAVIFHAVTYHLHEALICQESSSVSVCKDEFEQRLEKILAKKISRTLRFSNSWNGRRGEVSIGLHPVLHIEQTFSR